MHRALFLLSLAATLFAQGDLQARKVPMSPEEILESAMLVYLKGLGILTGDKTAGKV